MPVLPRTTTILLLALAACGSPQGKEADLLPLRAAEPPSDYTLIVSADTRDDRDLQVGVNTGIWDYDDVIDGREEDEMIPFTFGHQFYWAVWTEFESEGISIFGDGLTVESPIDFYSPVEADDELRSAINAVRIRVPDCRNIVGRLYRGPDRRYLLLVEFDSAVGPNALYVDVTNWARANSSWSSARIHQFG